TINPTNLLRASINDAIIQKPRHQILILIVARFSSRMSRYTLADFTRAQKGGEMTKEHAPSR
ncbi:hypothetical protein, partial [Hyphomonas sp.]|uniref:hypothetical protein n=1 Tax=Hyphomonas sp. TaxID=87 RepID=UPI0025C6944B